jgi:hypothetical protein
MKKISFINNSLFYILSSCGKEEQQLRHKDLQVCSPKITTEDATTYRDFTANIEGSKMWKSDQK